MAEAPPESSGSGLSEEMLRVIRGEIPPEEKRDLYRDSLGRWWKHYSHRKNDEEEHVADSLLYDERCHLPRTTPGPRMKEDELEPEIGQAQETMQQQGGATSNGNGTLAGKTT